NCGIHWWISTNWNAGPFGENFTAIAMVIPRVTSDVTSAICLVSRSRGARAAVSSELTVGMIEITSAPARGIAPMTVSQGKELITDQILTRRKAPTSSTAPTNMDRA